LGLALVAASQLMKFDFSTQAAEKLNLKNRGANLECAESGVPGY
jgi:hypothetical protein